MDDVSIRHGCPCFQLKHTGHNIRTEKIVKYKIVFGLGKAPDLVYEFQMIGLQAI
jgi:hypothetical protein